MRRLILRSMSLLALSAGVPACADRAPAPTAATAPVPAPAPAFTPPPQPPEPDNLAPPPREVKPREPLDSTLAHEGRQLVLKMNCASCHRGIANAKAPNLEALYGSKVALKGGAFVTADEAYLAESIRNPKAKVVEGWEPIMPAYNEEALTADELKAVIEYIKSVRDGDLKPKGDVFSPPVGAPTGK